MSDTKTTSSGIGFFSLLGLLFIGLKIGGAIDWSWWYVTLPLYVSYVMVFSLFVLFVLGHFAGELILAWNKAVNG